MLREKPQRKQNFLVTIWYSLSLAVHLIALALWLGGIVFFLIVLGPAVQDLEPRSAIRTLNQGRIGIETLSWIAIALLLASGTFNLIVRLPLVGESPSQAYGIILGIKLLIFSAMIAHHCLQVFKYAPTISRLTEELPAAVEGWPEPLLALWRRWFFLLKLNAALGPIAILLGLALTKI